LKTYAAMYGLIWLCLIQILFLYFSPFDDASTVAVHGTLGVLIFVLAFYISRKVQSTSCPDRIKRITRTTRNLALFQGLLGLALAGVVMMSLATIYASVIGLIHLANSLAIITQASSSATAYDMWEEREFQAAPMLPVQTT
jgi:cytochrome b561